MTTRHPRRTDVLLADDQPEVRSALRLIVEQLPGFRVVGEAGDAVALLASCARHTPDLILLDWELPGSRTSSTHGAVAAVRGVAPEVLVIVLSVRQDAEAEALAPGADAFVGKSEPPSRLIETLDALRR